jgi:hypothetical protein
LLHSLKGATSSEVELLFADLNNVKSSGRSLPALKDISSKFSEILDTHEEMGLDLPSEENGPQLATIMVAKIKLSMPESLIAKFNAMLSDANRDLRAANKEKSTPQKSPRSLLALLELLIRKCDEAMDYQIRDAPKLTYEPPKPSRPKMQPPLNARTSICFAR